MLKNDKIKNRFSVLKIKFNVVRWITLMHSYIYLGLYENWFIAENNSEYRFTYIILIILYLY